MTQENHNNTETKILTHLVYWLAIIGALIGPYLVHERRIADMKTDIAVVKTEVITIRTMLEQHIENDKSISMDY